MLTGQNGILNRTAEAKEKTEAAQKDEEKTLQGYEDIIAQYTGSLPLREETKPYFPSSTFSYKEGDLSTGLVIKDSSDNEYVWVEVPRTDTVYPNAGINITEFTDEEYTKIESDLNEYTKDYKKNTDYRDVYYEDSTNGWYKNEAEYNMAKKKMLKSIYQNEGFWVGRYEAGIDGSDRDISLALKENTTISSPSTKAVSKKDMIPYNFVNCSQAQKLASKMSTSSNKTSSLLFGIQWDLACKFLEENSNLDQIDIKTDSYKWGNYANTEFKITSTNAKQYISSWQTIENFKKEKMSLLSTGASEYTRILNIYDFAGNEWEWTLAHATIEAPNSDRGGSYRNNSEDCPVSHFSHYNKGCIEIGFRVTFY